jgi:hypothetical protein
LDTVFERIAMNHEQADRHTHAETLDRPWSLLYRIGGVAALLAVLVFRRNLSAELTAFNGFGLFAVPATLPVSAAEWFALLQADALVGLTLLGVFDGVEYVLVGMLFLAACVALWPTRRSSALLAASCGLVGIAVFLASNQALGLLRLGAQHAMATTDAQRAAFLAAGEALLALSQHGTGVYLSLFLVLLAGLIFSIAMLRADVFGKATAIIGILANGIGLLFFPALAFGPALYVIPPVLSAPLRLAWYTMMALRLFKLARAG